MDRIFGHPVIDPPGKVAFKRSILSLLSSRTPSIVETRWNTFLYVSRDLCFSTFTLPPLQTFPISFLKRSTIIDNSASSLRLFCNSDLRLLSSSNVFPRGLVPFIGFASTLFPSCNINLSGDVDTIW